MGNSIPADIFFSIISVAAVVFVVSVIVITVYAVRILRDVKDVSDTVRDESRKIAHDIDSLRESVKKEKAQVKNFFNLIPNLFRRNKGVKTKKRAKVAKSPEEKEKTESPT